MVKNHHRADHKVNDVFGEGCNVRLSYKGYEVSLSMDGENTIVFKDLSPVLFEAYRTTGEAVLSCFQFIDILEKS